MEERHTWRLAMMYMALCLPCHFHSVFFGTKYTQCLIGSNGELGFDFTYANGPITWTYGAIPSAQSGEIGSIMYPYMDIYFPDGGTIYTATYGSAPCRVFVVSGDSCSYFDGGLCPTQYITSQVVLHESTNQIDVNIKHKDVCTAWNSGNSTLGIENVAGTIAYPVPGKNATDWSADSLSYSFIPAGNSNNSITYAWYDTATNTLIGTTDSLIVCPLVTTTYRLHITSFTSCDSFTADNYVTIQVGGGIDISSETLVQPTTCGACNGEIILHGLTPFEVDTVFFKKNTISQTPMVLTSAADGTLHMTGLCSGTYSDIVAKHGVCVSNTVGPLTLNNPPITASFLFSIGYSCDGDTAYFTNTSTSPGATTVNSTWTYGDGNTGTATSHVFQTQGDFDVLLTFSNGFCTDTVSHLVNTLHPLHASFSVNSDTICRDGSISFTNTSITSQPTGIPPTYYWTFGDGGSSEAMSPVYNYNNTDSGQYLVLLNVTDFVPCSDMATKIIDILWQPYQYNYTAIFCSDGVQQISVNVDNVMNYKWSTGDSVCCIVPTKTGIYTVSETNQCGTTNDEVNVRIDSCAKCLFVPNAFTPNNDGVNDILHVRPLCPIRNYSIKIFNRYGQMVYASNYVNEGWDGTFNGVAVDIGTYFYTIEYTPDVPVGAFDYFAKGDVTVVR